MGGQLTKEEDSSSNETSTISVRNPFDLKKESEKKIVKVDQGGDQKITSRNVGEEDNNNDDDDDDFDPSNYDPKTVGPILPNGDINWECPCLGGAATGPCGTEFRQAFSCFHFSKEDPKGSDCFPQFREMHLCFSKYPQLYPSKDDDDDDDDNGDEDEEEEKEGQDDEDQIKFDEDELKVINEESENKGDNKDTTKENKEQEDKKSSKKESEPSVPSKDKKIHTPSPPRKEKKESILTPPQPAIM